MILSLALVALGLVLLTAGGEALVRGATVLSLRIGLTPVFVGLTVVAFGTSAPELAVNVNAALDGLGGLALGNVVGSNVANVGLILGVAALVRPLTVRARLVRVDMPVLFACSALVAALVLVGNGLGRLAGALLLVLLAGYLVFSLRAARRERDEVRAGFSAAAARARAVPWQAVVLVVAGLAALAAGAGVFVRGAVQLATLLGMSPGVIGLTVVAVGTSLPELATSAVAAWRREGDIAVGNVVGSNLFNLLAVLGLTAVVAPVAAQDVGPADLGVMLLAAAALWLVTVSGVRINRLEGAMLLGGYFVYVVWLLQRTPL